MSLRGAIATFATGTYVVTRTAAGTRTDGKYTSGAASTLSMLASIQPVRGRDLADLPEGQRGDELRVAYTETELRTRGVGDPDKVAIDGESWTVVRVERWQAFGGVHYRAYLARTGAP